MNHNRTDTILQLSYKKASALTYLSCQITNISIYTHTTCVPQSTTALLPPTVFKPMAVSD